MFLLPFPLDREPRWIEMGERSFQLVELLRGAVQFHSDQVSYLEPFGEQLANVGQMGENARGIGITFAAENFVAVDREPIEKILLLGRGFIDESRHRRFERIELSWMNFKVGMKTDEVRQRIHLRNVGLACERVEQPVRLSPIN